MYFDFFRFCFFLYEQIPCFFQNILQTEKFFETPAMACDSSQAMLLQKAARTLEDAEYHYSQHLCGYDTSGNATLRERGDVNMPEQYSEDAPQQLFSFILSRERMIYQCSMVHLRAKISQSNALYKDMHSNTLYTISRRTTTQACFPSRQCVSNT